MIITEDDQLYLAAWTASRIPHLQAMLVRRGAPFGVIRPEEPLPFRAMAAVRDRQIVAAIVYDRYHHWGNDCNDVQATFAAEPGWARRDGRAIVRGLLGPPFEQWGCIRVTCLVGATNTKCWKMLEKLGFEREGLHPFALDGTEDLLSYGLLKDRAQRWLTTDR